MSAQLPKSQSLMPQWFGSLPSSRQLLIWSGAGLAFTAYGMTHLPSPLELMSWAGLAGAGVWGIRRFWRTSDVMDSAVVRSLTLTQVKQAIAQTQLQLEQLVAESPQGLSVRENDTAALLEIEQSLSRQTLELQIVGTRAVGKATLRQLLTQQLSQTQWALTESEAIAAEVVQSDGVQTLKHIDVVLFVIQGDLTQGEWLALQQIQVQRKRVLLLLNKQDQYLPAQADLLLEQIKRRVEGIVAAKDVVAIATAPQPIKVRRYQADGAYEDHWETPLPQIQPLLDQMQQVATQEVNQLILQRAHQQTLALQEKIQNALNQIRRDRAVPLIERYQWIAAGAAFANPLPSLDMVATAAITGKMIQDLAQTYQIQLSLDRATEIAGVLAKIMIQMCLVEASSQLISSVLKGNAATFIVGGTIQGVGAAYFTRIAGLSLIELFEVYRTAESGWRLDDGVLGQIVQRVFGQHQRLEVFKNLVQQTLHRLKPEGEAALASV
jgi:hypothetical protein